jgi:hypothetical protein
MKGTHRLWIERGGEGEAVEGAFYFLPLPAYHGR